MTMFKKFKKTKKKPENEEQKNQVKKFQQTLKIDASEKPKKSRADVPKAKPD